MKKITVEIVKNFPFTIDGQHFEQAFAGTKVALPEDWIADLSKKGYVERDPLDHDGNGKKGGSMPGDDEAYTAAELIAAAEADPPLGWPAFKAAADVVLGADAPSKKADILIALKDKAAADAAAAT